MTKLADLTSRIVRAADDDELEARRDGRPKGSGSVMRVTETRIVSGFKIDASVPFPKSCRTRSSAIANAMDALEPGQSFFQAGRKTASVPAYAKTRWPTRYFIARKVEGGCRIWRKN